MKLITNWLVNAAALWVTAELVPGVSVEDTGALFLAALVIGLVNAIVRPVLAFVTLPITVLTLGLFYFVLNGGMIYLAAELSPGFAIDGWLTAIIAAIVMSIVATILHLFVGKNRKED
ncbi:MAG: phage holin family protein [Gemmatimonadota bacterium]|nr:phage holin family protein [Gemmatimonadota bacterium]